ncbi:MAG: restriction endonuclease subunit S [Desulfonatronovibrionaceae bacterium]
MGNDWKRCELGDLISINPSRPLSKGVDSVYISMQQVESENRSVNEIAHRPFKGSGSRFQNGDTLLARITPCLENGKTAYVDFLEDMEVGHGSTEFIVLSGIEGVTDKLFVYYLSRLPQFRNFAIARMEGSSGRQRVPAPTLQKYSFYCPPYEEQRAIAHILGSFDDKIELNRQMNETLESMARAIFKSWFVDFDPVYAKAEGRDTGLPEEIAALFPDSFEDSELGEIPAGWRVLPLSEVLDIIGGGTPKTKVKEYWDGDIPWFSVVDAPSETDVFVTDTEKHITQLGVEKSSAKVLRKGTTIISARGTVGKCALVGRSMAMNQSCYGLQSKHGISDYFVYFTIRRQVADLQRSGHGSVFNTITRDTFKTLRIACPPAKLTNSFDSMLKPLMDYILANINENGFLASLRETLLPKLISGELRPPNAEKFIEEAGL